MQPDKLTGIETVDLGNNEKLVITNWGCEYYCLSFHFETERYHADVADMNYWWAAATALMDDVQRGINASIDIDKGIATMKAYKGLNGKIDKGQEIDFGDRDMRHYVTLDSVSQRTEKRYTVDVTFTEGPL